MHRQLTKVDLNFNIDNDGDDLKDPVKTVKLFVEENGEVFYKPLIFKYIETKRFKKHENELVSGFDKWMYCLNSMKKLTEIPLTLKGDPIFEKLLK